MMRRLSTNQMAKCHLYLPKEEYKKYAELSADLSMNQFFMRMIRKGIAELEQEEKQKKEKGERNQTK